MNRELKFRAWVADHAPDYGDAPECVMFYSTEPNTTQMIGDRELRCCGGAKPQGVLESFLRNPRTPVMQYTGLKDKNGKEVYEGDIVSQGDNYPSEIRWNHNGELSEGTGWVLVEHYSDGYGPRVHTTDAYTNGLGEVIGNIYENPDLLQGNE